MREKNPEGYWRATVENFGWDKRSGHKSFQSLTGEDLLRQILPDTECTYKIHRYGKSGGLAIQNFHHDSPSGDEWYYIVPITKAAYEKGDTTESPADDAPKHRESEPTKDAISVCGGVVVVDFDKELPDLCECGNHISHALGIHGTQILLCAKCLAHVAHAAIDGLV